MLRKTAGFFMFITGCIMVIGMSIFLIYYNIIQKHPIEDNLLLLYTLYITFTIFIAMGYSIIDNVEKKRRTQNRIILLSQAVYCLAFIFYL